MTGPFFLYAIKMAFKGDTQNAKDIHEINAKQKKRERSNLRPTYTPPVLTNDNRPE